MCNAIFGQWVLFDTQTDVRCNILQNEYFSTRILVIDAIFGQMSVIWHIFQYICYNPNHVWSQTKLKSRNESNERNYTRAIFHTQVTGQSVIITRICSCRAATATLAVAVADAIVFLEVNVPPEDSCWASAGGSQAEASEVITCIYICRGSNFHSGSGSGRRNSILQRCMCPRRTAAWPLQGVVRQKPLKCLVHCGTYAGAMQLALTTGLRPQNTLVGELKVLSFQHWCLHILPSSNTCSVHIPSLGPWLLLAFLNHFLSPTMDLDGCFYVVEFSKSHDFFFLTCFFLPPCFDFLCLSLSSSPPSFVDVLF